MSHDAQFTQANMVRFERPMPRTGREGLVCADRYRHCCPAGTATGDRGRVGGRVEPDGRPHQGHRSRNGSRRRKLAYTWNVFMPATDESDYPESYLTLELDGAKL